MKKLSLKILRPELSMCNNCVDKPICIAIEGKQDYQCPRLVHPQLFSNEGKIEK